MRARILFVDFITTFGGVQRVMANMIPELVRYMDVIYIDALEDGASQAVFKRVGVPLGKLQIWPRRQVLGFKGSLLHKLGVLFIWGPAHMLYAVRLAAYAKRYGFQVIYTNSKKGLMVCTAAGFLARLPVVYHCHGLEGPEDVDAFYRAAIRACRAVIAVSQDVKRKLVAAGIPDDLVYVVYNGINLEQLVEASASQNGSDVIAIGSISAPKYLVACNLQKGKGVHMAIEALRILKSRGHLVHLNIAGDVPRGGDSHYRDHLYDMVHIYGLQDQVHFLGWRTDLAAVMRMCDVLLVPSIAGESFGMVAAEAMALGKPVIASRVGGLPEVVADGQTGFLFEPGDAEELADRIWQLVSDISLYQRFSREAQRWVADHFTVQRQACRIAGIIGEIVNGSVVGYS